MRQIILRALLGLVLASGGLTALAATYRYYGPHVTNQTPWINTIVVYNNGALAGSFEITVWDEAGAVWHQQEYLVPATASLGMVMSNDPGHIPDPEEIPLVPVEGT
ncbi:MAG: hypothetical protein JXQ27_07725, partial [Acidobacteria bacterium]|nr:hypothetical protein [Acidobacteriota bacterium]